MNIGYVTILSSEDYLTGIAVTIASLQATGTQIPIYCLTTPDISEDTLLWLVQNFGVNIIKQEDTHFNNLVDLSEQARKKYLNLFNKVSVFGLTQFDKIVYLDGDLFINKNIDDLFLREHLSCVIDSIFVNLDQEQFNDGVMVIQPNKDLFEECCDFLENATEEALLNNSNILNQLFMNWKHQKRLKLPMEYNVMVNHFDEYNSLSWFNPLNVRIWHFVGDKPWKITEEYLSKLSTDKRLLFLDYLNFIQTLQRLLEKKDTADE